MFISSASLPLREHPSADVQRKAAHIGQGGIKPPLRVGSWKIAGAIAKTVFADPSPTYVEKALRTSSAFIQLQANASLHPASSNLRLDSQRFQSPQGFRDFSGTSRIGELGQGLCALFMQDHLELPIVLDFAVLCDQLGISPPPHDVSTPDFAGWRGDEYWLVESKATLLPNGEGSAKTKTKLREGISQCDAGARYIVQRGGPPPARSFCVLTEFKTDAAPDDTVIRFTDPAAVGGGIADDLHDRIAKHYYASALTALGGEADSLDNLLTKGTTKIVSLPDFPGVRFEPVETARLPAFMGPDIRRATAGPMRPSVYIESRIVRSLRAAEARTYRIAAMQWLTDMRRSMGRGTRLVAWADGIVWHSPT